MTQLERLKKENGRDYEPAMPVLKGPNYLIGYLFEMGPGMDGAMGMVPISYSEMYAWALLTGVKLLRWEARLLRSLSRAYVSELHKNAAQPPWQAPDEKPAPTAAQLAIRNLARL